MEPGVVAAVVAAVAAAVIAAANLVVTLRVAKSSERVQTQVTELTLERTAELDRVRWVRENLGPDIERVLMWMNEAGNMDPGVEHPDLDAVVGSLRRVAALAPSELSSAAYLMFMVVGARSVDLSDPSSVDLFTRLVSRAFGTDEKVDEARAAFLEAARKELGVM